MGCRTTCGDIVSFAVVDIGSGSLRYAAYDDSGSPVDGRSVITRLGASLDQTGRLDDDAIARSLDALRSFRAEHVAVTEWHALATAACREATNGHEFLREAEAILGRAPRVLSGDDEGNFAFAGAVSALPPTDGQTVVIDIGGASTEFVVGHSVAEHVMSVRVGALRLTRAELPSDPPRPEELTNAIGVMTDHVDDIELSMPMSLAGSRFVGVGGTFSTMAAVEIGMPVFDRGKVHGFVLTREAAEDVFRTLATESLADRVHNPGLSPERAPFIVGGCCAVVAIMRRLHLTEITVSTANVLDGFAASIVAGKT
jgi:exopolyphosphatase / guanosine-5'-triphosphate,3'-diphosphate pyrophosphatase